MKIILPDLPTNDLRAGVYKFTFNSGHFYIGGTKHLRIRFFLWKDHFKRGYIQNKRLLHQSQVSSDVSFEILEYVTDLSTLFNRETLYLQRNKDNPLILNRSFDGHSNKGIKWTQEEVAAALKNCPLRGKRGKNKIKKTKMIA